MKSRGFTLIELLIVVAIVGMILAIVVPQFVKYQNNPHVGLDEVVIVKQYYGGRDEKNRSREQGASATYSNDWAMLEVVSTEERINIFGLFGNEGDVLYVDLDEMHRMR